MRSPWTVRESIASRAVFTGATPALSNLHPEWASHFEVSRLNQITCLKPKFLLLAKPGITIKKYKSA
ncbi:MULTISPECIES: hypothetical protein [unclassified Microcoleus]|uniref:hypothetical protein n=1 Tax=unclassified Microcoleus TaxID=2642155 RepID=UPI002FD42A4E